MDRRPGGVVIEDVLMVCSLAGVLLLGLAAPLHSRDIPSKSWSERAHKSDLYMARLRSLVSVVTEELIKVNVTGKEANCNLQRSVPLAVAAAGLGPVL